MWWNVSFNGVHLLIFYIVEINIKSIAFLSCSHLAYSGHVGECVISSEEAIAKGIRRIVALTGPDATKVNAKYQFNDFFMFLIHLFFIIRH